MPAIRPIKQKELIRFLRKLDFIGPYSGGKHQFMVKGDLRIRIPNPHKKDIGKNLLDPIRNCNNSTVSHRMTNQAMCLYFYKKSSGNGRFSVLEDTFQGQKHGCKNLGFP